MELTIFAKKRTSKEGKSFYTYLTKLTEKTGEEVTVQVKFREDCGQPKGEKCPCNIVCDKSDLNYTEKINKYIDEDSQTEKEATSRILWVSNWSEGSEYVDTSMDRFAD